MFVLDTGFHVFVWVGKEATSQEKGGGLIIAHVSLSIYSEQSHRNVQVSYFSQEYVKNSNHPFLPITRVTQGQSLESFESVFDDKVAVSVFTNVLHKINLF